MAHPPHTTPNAASTSPEGEDGDSRKAPRRINFTVKSLAALAPPSTGRVYTYDTLIRGLAVCITANDARTFYLYRWVNDRPERIKLGKVGEITIEQARRMAGEKLGQIAAGINPQRQKVETREEATFGELFTAYLEKYKKPLKPKSAKQDEYNYKLHLSHWKARRLSDITRADVVDLHRAKGAKHPYLANRLLSLISVMFNQANNVGIRFAGENPAEGVARFQEAKREKYLNATAMPKFFAALDSLRYKTTADFFRVALFTGQRRSNVQAMRWEQLDLDAGVWNIPDTKKNTPHTVPLVAEVVKVLEARRPEGAVSGWVFPSHSGAGHLVEPKTAWRAVLKAAGLEGYRVHDLRHTIASWQAAAGTSLQIIGKGLGHTQTRTTERYAHVENSPVREAMGRAVAGMMKAAKPKTKRKPKSQSGKGKQKPT
jgi:integrase